MDGLQNYFPFGKAYFQVLCLVMLVSGRVKPFVLMLAKGYGYCNRTDGR